jgi:hypothetical protein
MRHILFILGLIGMILILPACGKTKKTLGLDHHQPDAMAVVERKPLEIPKDLNRLPTPITIDSDSSADQTAIAKDIVLPQAKTTTLPKDTKAEDSLLQKAKIIPKDKSNIIREELKDDQIKAKNIEQKKTIGTKLIEKVTQKPVPVKP